jgi:LysR family glycine cleavage system transcriptional activator
MLPPLNGLRAFEAVARHLNFTRAAEELNVTQSAVSHQIRNLEAFLGTDLFTRAGGKLSLTADGAALLPDISEAFTAIQRAAASLKAASGERPLCLVTRPHFASRWLAPRLARLWQRHPGFDLRIRHSNHSVDLTNGQIDLAIEWRRKDAVDSTAQLLVEGDLVPACSPKLLKGDAPVGQPADLAAHALLHGEDARAWRDWLALAGVPDLIARRNHVFDDTNVRQEAAIAGEGFSLVCPHLIADDIAAGRLVCPFDIRLDAYAYFLLIPKRPPGPQSRKFAAWLLDEAGAA